MSRSHQKPPHWLALVLILTIAGLAMMVWLSTEGAESSGQSTLAISSPAPSVYSGPVPVFEEQLHPPVEQPHKPAETAPPVNGVALIIDDVGYDLQALQRLIDLPFEVAIAILPDAPKAAEASTMAFNARRTVMLHLPMEPSNPKYQAKMNRAFLRQGMDQESVTRIFRWALDKVPHAQGVNNHMGSLLTSKPQIMEWVMALCREKGLFFVDSKTVSASVAADIAADYGLAWGERRIFLDHSTEIEDMELAWQAARRCAKNRGGCIVIGHPYPETLQFLEQHVSEQDYVLFHPISEMLHRAGGAG